ncbi:MAG: hypothetical protein KAH54_02120 [Candidatus Sabulitectum sp.]|nr:hypothetical protein [Candidatus Sabulitectum sp.]
MKIILIVLTVACSAASFAQSAIDLSPVNRADSDWLRYDNGTPEWFAYEGIYKGVWFNLEDFMPGWSGGAALLETETWFYHDSQYPWDTSDFYSEIWNGDPQAPLVQLDQTRLNATHYAPVFTIYSTPLMVNTNFWVLANTELSSGGWPSIISDDNNSEVAHSFFTHDFILWEPWIPGEGQSNYFIAVSPALESLDATTWGELKTAF